MRLPIGWQQRALPQGRPLRHKVQMGFQAIFAERQRFIFVDLDLERILRRQIRRGAQQDPRSDAPRIPPGIAPNLPLS
jgi:hypothetical protein